MADEYKNYDPLSVRRFINFYIIRRMWFRNKHSLNELLSLLFPSKNNRGGNKTKLDNIFALNNVELDGDWLERITGIQRAYVIGEEYIQIENLILGDWIAYLDERRKQKGKVKTDKQIEFENKINMAIREMMKQPDKHGQAFQNICYFATYKEKRKDDTTENRIAQITTLISEISRRDLEQLHQQGALGGYGKLINKHLEHIKAVITLSEFK